MKNRLFFAFLCIFAIVQVVLFPTIYIDAFYFGLNVFCTALLPLLFPFFIFSSLLVQTGVLRDFSERYFAKTAEKLHLSKHFPYVFLLAILSGYPMNAKLTCDLYQNGDITKEECERLAFSTSCSGIIFVCVTVASVLFHTEKIGFPLLICHISSCILGYYTYNFFFHKASMTANYSTNNLLKINGDSTFKFNIFESFTKSVSSALSSILLVGAYVCIFSVLSKMLETCGLFPSSSGLLSAFLKGVFEITIGIKQISLIAITKLSLASTVALISFGGISINMQSLALLISSGVSSVKYFALKLFQMLWGFAITYLLFAILGY